MMNFANALTAIVLTLVLAAMPVKPAQAGDMGGSGAEFLLMSLAGTALIGGGIAYTAIHPQRVGNGLGKLLTRPSFYTNGFGGTLLRTFIAPRAQARSHAALPAYGAYPAKYTYYSRVYANR